MNRSIDISASAFNLYKVRAEAVDYLPTIMSSYQQIFIRNPAEQLDWGVYVMPVSRDGWIAVIVFCVTVPIFMAVVMYDCE